MVRTFTNSGSASIKRWNTNSFFSIVYSHTVSYPTPLCLNYAWSFNSIAGLCLVIQILSGVFLAIHYVPHIDYAFVSIEYIMRDVKYGWLLRYIYANTASFFFFVVYAHMFRSLYRGSYAYPRHNLWYSGLLIFLLLIATAFLGYVLPWGQMSFWGATVITSLFSALPEVGKAIVRWLWGGYSVDNATLNRFFSLHYVLPFAISATVLIHLALLHADGSNTPIGAKSTMTNFYPYFYVKDLFSFFVLLSCLSLFLGVYGCEVASCNLVSRVQSASSISEAETIWKSAFDRAWMSVSPHYLTAYPELREFCMGREFVHAWKQVFELVASFVESGISFGNNPGGFDLIGWATEFCSRINAVRTSLTGDLALSPEDKHLRELSFRLLGDFAFEYMRTTDPKFYAQLIQHLKWGEDNILHVI